MPDSTFTSTSTIPSTEHGLTNDWNGQVFTPLRTDEDIFLEVDLIPFGEQQKIFDFFLDMSAQIKGFSQQIERVRLRMNDRTRES